MCLLSRKNQLKGILRTVDKLPLPHLWNICRGFRRYGFKSWPSYFIFCGHANHNIDILTYFDKLSTFRIIWMRHNRECIRDDYYFSKVYNIQCRCSQNIGFKSECSIVCWWYKLMIEIGVFEFHYSACREIK